ncbi:MAG: hypothetical protein AAGF12_24210 [Myxococcota bacterium]
MNRWAWLLACFLTSVPAGAAAWNELPPGPTGFRDAGFEAIRGVTVGPIESSQQAGRGYGTVYSGRLLDELARMGVNWISITPFGRIWSLDSTEISMDFEAPYESNRDAIRTMVAQARARGIRVMLIPHLWVETGGWRGEIDPGNEDAWRTYRSAYADFVLRWAVDAERAGVDAFSIGVECKSWSGRFGSFWDQLIAQVRSVYRGLLTYSANWDEVDSVLFWDRLDLIGVNAFYPLAGTSGASYSTYVEGARAVVGPLAELAETLSMPVLFVEVGYTSRPDAAVEPWLWPEDLPHVVVDEHEQTRALQAIFEAFVPEEWFSGFFIWRYYANLDDVSQEAIWGFSPHAKSAEPFLDEVFDVRFGGDPEPWPWVTRQPALYRPPFRAPYL